MSQIATTARRHAQLITTGTLLAIDPASGGTSQPGWAAFRAGKLLDSGILDVAGRTIQERLRRLYTWVEDTAPDVLVIERIRGIKAHEHLMWAVGVTIAGVCPKVLIEMPVSTWKMLAGKGHKKSDESDAIAIGYGLLKLAVAA